MVIIGEVRCCSIPHVVNSLSYAILIRFFFIQSRGKSAKTSRKTNSFHTERSFNGMIQKTGVSIEGTIQTVQFISYTCIRFSGRRGAPVVEAVFKFQLFINSVIGSEAECFALPFLVGIGQAFDLTGIHEGDGIVAVHKGFSGTDTQFAKCYPVGILFVHNEFYSCSGQVLLGAAGKAEDHGEIAFFGTCQADRKVVPRNEGFVIGRIGCWFIIRTGIDAPDTEIARMSGPYPVVSFPTELSN